jgi:hypothetical protein
MDQGAQALNYLPGTPREGAADLGGSNGVLL